MLEVFTIGHSTRTWKVFLELLRVHGIKRVIDVRNIPRSRHNPQFNRETLSAKLRSAKIGYVHMRKLGGLRNARRDSPNKGWHNASFRGFADYMQTPDFEARLGRLIKLAKQKKSALMCAEALPWRCHRSLIADALFVRGIRAEDIMSPTRRPVHKLTPFAKVRGATITYPAEDSLCAEKKPRAKPSRSHPVEKTIEKQIRAGACGDSIIGPSQPGNARRRLPRRSRVPQP